MKKRLRKKRRIGEFTEHGFTLHFTIRDTSSSSDRNKLIDDFIAEIERLGLQFGGGGIDGWQGFVELKRRGRATEEHRKAIQDWLASHPKIAAVHTGPLVDVWSF